MRVAFRVDGSAAIGTGHVMRCLTLGNLLKARGAATLYLCRQIPAGIESLLRVHGHEWVRLGTPVGCASHGTLPHSHWLPCSQVEDADATLDALADAAWDWMVVDHYALDARWETAVRGSGAKIMVIDDLADRDHDCDLLLDQNLHAEAEARYAGKIADHCQTLLGPRFALLRDEFLQWRNAVHVRKGPVRRLLVFFGGIDRENVTERALEAIAGLGSVLRGMQVDVVVGNQHPQLQAIQRCCECHGFACHVQTSRMAELMAHADLAIGAGGSATWERCCLGLPAFVLPIADNQRQLVAEAARSGLLYAPEIGSESIGGIRQHLLALLENPGLRQMISHQAMQAVDGRGALRVVRHLGGSGITIRRATWNDAARLFEWRNHPSIRAVSRDRDPIDWPTHERWFRALLDDPCRVLVLGERGGKVLGVVRFDADQHDAEVSIYLVPGGEHCGAGADLLQAAEHWVMEHRPDIRTIRAHVLGDNARSRHLFVSSGYQCQSSWLAKRVGQWPAM